ncbi:hypothetical protein BDF20DRAFT_890990 [Mycotypha africana]|uniref:uncharacterized protein n=1 Tax=Mycotypha africana TaxID=64632 RepID=UPI002300CC42|nr:uncharacterized protein BDF20DRAFT_890990 [Mycotypha africana]KAI8970393.1 hypothetical protein BDF20DRAFT_890990 [Mycotypha africana]
MLMLKWLLLLLLLLVLLLLLLLLGYIYVIIRCTSELRNMTHRGSMAHVGCGFIQERIRCHANEMIIFDYALLTRVFSFTGKKKKDLL